MRAECFGQSRPQDGRQQTLNQDAFVIGRQPVPWMALCDGAGSALSVARRALGLFETRLQEVSLGQLLRDETWLRWTKGLDSALLGGPEATFVAAAVIGDQVIGVAAGDSRAYLTPFEGPVRLLTGSAAKARLAAVKRGESMELRAPEVDLEDEATFHTSRMKLALVAGVHPVADSRKWTVVARNGAPTRLLKAARLYPFTREGSRAACAEGARLRLRLKLDGSWTSFRSRVLVEGPWERPEAVIPAWVIEGLDRPIPVSYYFD